MRRLSLLVLMLGCATPRPGRTAHPVMAAYTPIPAGGGSGTVTSVQAGPGISVDATTPASPIVTNQNLASWPIANVRWYCLDGTNGSDSNVGFSDTSSADCGTKAKKTIGGLGAIFPQNGRAHKVVVRIASFDYTGQGGLDVILGSAYGYAALFPLVLPTVTSATAGCTAFDNSVADKLMAGFVTVPGLNAAGYNPVSGATASSLPSLTVGGSAPAFPAEPAEPMGWRVRFDAATTTAALRNFSAPIIGITTTTTTNDTLLLPNACTSCSALPAVPVISDIYYVEKAGVTVDQTNLTIWANTGSSAIRPPIPQFVGINFSGFPVIFGGRLLVVGSSGSFQAHNQLDTPPSYTDETNTARRVGCGLRAAGQVGFGGQTASINALGADYPVVFTSSASILNAVQFNFANGSYLGAGLSVIATKAQVSYSSSAQQPTSIIGGRTSNSQSPVRIVGTAAGAAITAGLNIDSSAVTLGRILITGSGAHPAIALQGQSGLSLDATATGSSGNTDVGLDLTKSVASDIVMAGTPTVTGTNGDVRLCDGTIVAWASLAALATVDTCGNKFISAGGNGGASAIANGTTATVQTGVGPAAASTSIQRWMKVPDTTGGYYLVPSYHATFPGTFDLSPFAVSPLDLN